jgi:two-component system sensor histidine kinase GlrK
VELQAAMQRLIDRGVAMERAARQYLVLAEPQLRRAYDEAREEAKLVVVQLEASGLPAEAAAGWQQALEAVDERLPERAAPLVLDDARLAPAFRALEERTEDLAVALRSHTARRNAEVQQALESARLRFAQQVAAGIVVAALAALGFGWWLSRPMRQLERAVLALGANRLDEPVRIDGPSDLRDLGRRLDWLRLRLQELDEDKSRFLRHISHELKTPLAALREGVALLEDGVAGALSADQKEIARILAHNTRTLQAQIEDLLRFNAAACSGRPAAWRSPWTWRAARML